MCCKVTNRTLLLFAGLVWVIAGTNILRIGIQTWLVDQHAWLINIGWAILIFCIFFFGIFNRMFHKHTQRISTKQEQNCPFAFFDTKGWIIMIFMISLGIVVRKLHLLPIRFIAVFYSGLSSALILTGCMFLFRWWTHKQHT